SATTGTQTITNSGPGSMRIDGVISDGATGGKLAIVQSSTTSTLTLTAANTFTGGTTVSAGTLVLSGGNNRLAPTSTVALAGTGTLNIGSPLHTLPPPPAPDT